jgi:phenylacetyl-CoA:acceptor oxidoreductase subunit 1
MVIDLRKCIGCETCKFVCLEMNRPPGGSVWRRVIDPGRQETSDGLRIFLPIGCMHCEKPPCRDVCPSGATRKHADGIVDVEFEKCIGCGACVVACPYGARHISDQDGVNPSGEAPGMASGANPQDRIGVSSKCHFCRPIVESGSAKGLKPGVDADATPHCVRHCLGEALHFGDLDDADSEVSRLIRDNRAIQLHEAVGTQPAVFYVVETDGESGSEGLLQTGCRLKDVRSGPPEN